MICAYSTIFFSIARLEVLWNTNIKPFVSIQTAYQKIRHFRIDKDSFSISVSSHTNINIANMIDSHFWANMSLIKQAKFCWTSQTQFSLLAALRALCTITEKEQTFQHLLFWMRSLTSWTLAEMLLVFN